MDTYGGKSLRKGNLRVRSDSVGLTKTTGTKISFLPDATIFAGLSFDADILEKRLRDWLFLTRGLKYA